LNQKSGKPPVSIHLLLALLVGLFIAVAFCYQLMLSAATAADSAAKDVVACQELVATISAAKVQRKPAKQVSREHSAKLIEQGKSVAGISDQQNPLVADQAQRQVSKTDFVAQPTQVKFADVTIEQLVKFLLAVSNEQNGMQVERIELTPGRSDGASAENWNVDLILTTIALSSKRTVSR